MKNLLVSLALLPLASLSALAATSYDVARVESVTPQYEQVRVVGPCRQVVSSERQVGGSGSGTGGSIVGGIVGGLLGSQVGGGSGRQVATAAGAITGAILGGNVERAGPSTQEVRTVRMVCEPDRVSSSMTGYLVTYEYLGQRSSVVMARDPGNTLEMRVVAEPITR